MHNVSQIPVIFFCPCVFYVFKSILIKFNFPLQNIYFLWKQNKPAAVHDKPPIERKKRNCWCWVWHWQRSMWPTMMTTDATVKNTFGARHQNLSAITDLWIPYSAALTNACSGLWQKQTHAATFPHPLTVRWKGHTGREKKHKTQFNKVAQSHLPPPPPHLPYENWAPVS